MAEANWFWAKDDQRNGPVLPSAIARLVADGKLDGDDLIWKEGMADWVPVKKVPALVKYLKQPAADSAAAPVAPTPPIAASAAKPVAKKAEAPSVAPAAVLAYQTAPVEPGGMHEYPVDPGTTIDCPHCSVSNTAGSQFCEACGMALPIPNSGPRIVDGASFASTSAGKQLQSEELQKQSGKASTALMWVAIIQTAVCGLILLVGYSNNRIPQMMENPVMLGMIVIAAIFWGLFIWSRKQPLPAAIVGLVLYATLVVVNIVTTISNAASNHGTATQNYGIGNTGIGWIDIVIMAVLVQAISAGLKYRKMNSGAPETAA